MKKTLSLFFFLLVSACIFGQAKYEGIWQLVDIPEEKITDPLNQHDIFEWSFTDTTKAADSLFKPLYFSCPHYIVWNKYDVCLVYGDIYDNAAPIIARRYGLRTSEGDCMFYWMPQTSMYEYMATWVKDHFVYYYDDNKGYQYEKIDPEFLTQRQKDLLEPTPEDAIYFQGRLRPIQPYYQCNIPQKN